MAFKPPTSNPTRECLPLVIQLMPYYAQYNELLILRELHSKLGDPGKKLHQQMLTDAITREQSAISSGEGLRAMDTLNQQTNLANGFGNGQKGFTQQNNMFLTESMLKNGSNNFVLTGGEQIPSSIWERTMGGGGGNGCGAMEMGGEGGGRSHENGQPIEDEDDVIIVNEEERTNNGSIGASRMNGTNSGGQPSFLNSGIVGNNGGQQAQQANPQNDPFSKRRADFLREASTLYNNKYRMLSRSVYEFYMKRLKITGNLDPRLLLKKDLEIRNKFELTIFVENGIPTERLVERGKEHRKLVAIEEVFDVVHAFHERIGHGKRMAIYDAIKREYANITLNCVLLYMAGCQNCYSTGGEPTQQPQQPQMETTQRMGSQSQAGETEKMQMETNRTSSPRKKTVESRAAKLGLDEINYAEHFIIGEDEIRCRHCHFVYFHKSRQRPRHSLRSHLRNYHRKLFNQMAIGQNGGIQMPLNQFNEPQQQNGGMHLNQFVNQNGGIQMQLQKQFNEQQQNSGMMQNLMSINCGNANGI